jgi:hypothetical protein
VTGSVGGFPVSLPVGSELVVGDEWFNAASQDGTEHLSDSNRRKNTPEIGAENGVL